MTYSDITFNDKNFIKRWLQSKRLLDALSVVDSGITPKTIVDYGSGNGELCKYLIQKYPDAEVICYEPTESLLSEAKINLSQLNQISFTHDISFIQDKKVDLLFCLEVFEHLPPIETELALKEISRLLKFDGISIIGVPIEIGPTALLKGIFRMRRRYGAYDANLRNIFLASIYKPPTDRPIAEITTGFPYYFEHMGFDYRNFERLLKKTFSLGKIYYSPLNLLKIFNSEILFSVKLRS